MGRSLDQWINGSIDRLIGTSVDLTSCGRVEILDELAWGRGLSVSPGKEFTVENMAVTVEVTAKLLKLWFSLFFLICLTHLSSLVKVNKEIFSACH